MSGVMPDTLIIPKLYLSDIVCIFFLLSRIGLCQYWLSRIVTFQAHHGTKNLSKKRQNKSELTMTLVEGS